MGELRDEARRVLARLDAATAADANTRAYVERLEAMVDEARRPAGDDLITEIERFLREQGGDGERSPGTVTEAAADRSYRALLRVPTLGRIILSMQIARTAQSMLSVALVLFTLAEYDSPGLAGIVTFASIFPGLLISPIAGALLDRHGRVRLIVVDYAVALVSLALIGGLALAGLLPAGSSSLIALVSSVTGIFSHTGLRSLFPILVPRHLWERVNAIDSNGYVVATIIGPPLAAGLVATVGGPPTILAIAVAFGVAGLVMIRVPEPARRDGDDGTPARTTPGRACATSGATRPCAASGFSLSIVNLASGHDHDRHPPRRHRRPRRGPGGRGPRLRARRGRRHGLRLRLRARWTPAAASGR